MKEAALDARNTAAPAISSGADPPQRRRNSFERLRILPKGGRDAIDPYVMPSHLDREVARELGIGGLQDIVGADALPLKPPPGNPVRSCRESCTGQAGHERPIPWIDHAR